MISWARFILGQTQEGGTSDVDADEAVAPGVPQSGRGSRRGRGPRPVVSWILSLTALGGVVGAAGIGVLLNRQLQRAEYLERDVRSAREQVSRLQSHNESLTQQLADVQRQRLDLDERVFSLSVQLSSAAAELAQTEARLAQSQQLADALSDTQDELKAKMADAETARAEERQEAHQEVASLKQENTDLGRAVTRLRHRLTLLERDYTELAEQFATVWTVPNPDVQLVSEAAPIPPAALIPDGLPDVEALATKPITLLPVTIQPAAAEGRRLTGRLVEVNRPMGFAILDKGRDDGVREGMVFDVVRGSEAIAAATVVRVRKELAACDLNPHAGGAAIQPGDLAMLRGEEGR